MTPQTREAPPDFEALDLSLEELKQFDSSQMEMPPMREAVAIKMEGEYKGQKLVLYELQPKQFEALSKTPLYRRPDQDGPIHIGYGGAAGGGKSHLSRALAVKACIDWPGCNVLILRRTKGEVYTNHVKLFRREVPETLPDGRSLYDWNGSQFAGCATFSNESDLYFGFMKESGDETKYQGLEFDLIVFEEATHYLWDQVRYLTGERMRATTNRSRPFAFYPSNPGNRGHCLPDGDVLTTSGWMPIEDVAEGESVFTVDESGELQETAVAQTHREYYDGELIEVDGRNLTIRCTPNHKVAKVGGTRENRGAHHSLVPFEDLPNQAYVLRSVDWSGRDLSDVEPPEVPREAAPHDSYPDQPGSLSGRDYAALLGWFLSEGHTIDRDMAFAISQASGESQDRLRHLLEDRCGFTPYWTDRYATIYDRRWWKLFRKFGGAREKYIPERVKNASKADLRALFRALMDGDGHWYREGRSGTYYTTSKRLAEDVEEVALKLGYQVYTSSRLRENRDHRCYEVNLHRTKAGGTEIITGQHVYDVDTEIEKDSHVRRVPYRGWVYCLGIPETHNFIVKQNGSVWVSGNSWYKRLFIEGDYDPDLSEEPGDYAFVQSYVWDNKVLLKRDPQYIRNLATLPEPLRSWRLWGDWSAGLGLAVPQINRRTHLVDSFNVPDHWPTFGAFDWGYNHPFSFGVYAVSEDERIYKLDTITGRRKLPTEIARYVRGALTKWGLAPEDLAPIWAGHDCWSTFRSRGESTPTIAETFHEQGFRLVRARNYKDRVIGLNNLRKYLSWEGVGPDGENVRPYLLFFDNQNNRNCVRQIGNMPTDPDNPEDALKQDADESGRGGDDMYDETRYAAASRPPPARSTWEEQSVDPWSEEAIKAEADRQKRGNLPGQFRDDGPPQHREFGQVY